jgi:hypothetical protein
MAVAHVVLFDLRPDLGAEGKQRFYDALVHALAAIPAVERIQVGRRLSIGAGYENLTEGFTYIAVIAFGDAAGLREYLRHEAHAELGALFWSSTSRSMVLDFELAGDDLSHAVAAWS